MYTPILQLMITVFACEAFIPECINKEIFLVQENSATAFVN